MIHLRTELPGPKSRVWMERREAAVPRGLFHVTPVFIEEAHGATLIDVDGNHLLDFSSGIGTLNVGHRNTSVVSAIQRQCERFLHLSFNVSPYELYVLLAEKLNASTPGSFAKKTFLANSGAEAVENAVKMARAYTKRPAVVCFEHAFHGRTYLAMSLTGKARPYKVGFGPFCPEVYRVPFPDAYRWPANEDVSEACFEHFVAILDHEIAATEVAAVILEPVLGEGGFIPAPARFVKQVREYCSRNGILLIADEIQTGFGRTGTLFACQQLDLVPDLLCSAKGLGGGLPISAVTGRAEVMDAPVPGGIGGTFGGNPVACAAALAVFAEMETTQLLSRARAMGELLAERLSGWKERFSSIGDVRGLGPMRAMEFVKDRRSKEPNPEAAKAVAETAWRRGLVVMTAGTYGNVIRLLPPLSISDAELDEGLAILDSILSATA